MDDGMEKELQNKWKESDKKAKEFLTVKDRAAQLLEVMTKTHNTDRFSEYRRLVDECYKISKEMCAIQKEINELMQ